MLQARASKNGKLIWDNPTAAARFFAGLEDGTRMTVSFEPGRRGPGLNKLLHAIFAEFSRRTGYSPAAAKEYLKAQFIEDGRGTATLNSEECGAFAEFCQAWLALNLD